MKIIKKKTIAIVGNNSSLAHHFVFIFIYLVFLSYKYGRRNGNICHAIVCICRVFCLFWLFFSFCLPCENENKPKNTKNMSEVLPPESIV